MSETPVKLCLQCSKPFKGRSDKKFCCHYCRTDYNNIKQKKKQAACIKTINEILLHNRDILLELIKRKIKRTTEDRLVAVGFHFHFFTHSIKRGTIVKFYCYDVGYTKQSGIIKIMFE